MMKDKRELCFNLRKIISVLTCVVLSVYIILTYACQIKHMGQSKISKDIYAMDTYMSLSVYENEETANDILGKAADEIRRIEGLVSAHKEESELAQLNEQGKAIFSKDGSKILEKSLQIYEMTEGAFNPAIYPVMELWGFTTKEYRVPKQEELKNKLANMDMKHISIEYLSGNSNNSSNISDSNDSSDSNDTAVNVTVPSGMKLDFGGIAKGYASDRVISLFEENNIESAIVSLGGNVHALGTKPDGSPWKTAIRHPENEGYLGVVSVTDKAVITSGGYERYFEEGGKTYHHIIDPATGYPADNKVASVSIISDDGMLADGLSTALYVMGYENAVSLWKANHEKFDFVMMTEDGKLYVTEGIENSFESDYEYGIVYAR